MKTFYSIFLMMSLLLISGCASTGEKSLITNLKAQLAMTSLKIESLKKENDDLKNEKSLFQKKENPEAEKFLKALSILKKDLAKDIANNNAWLETMDRGLDIIVLSEVLFISGTDSLSEEGKILLDVIGSILKEDFFSNYVFIEGHTDNQSLAVFEWKSDWDFSFARALSVLKYFAEKNYVDSLRLSAAGFGRYRPRDTNATKEGRRTNRRIEIIISPRDLESAKE